MFRNLQTYIEASPFLSGEPSEEKASL